MRVLLVIILLPLAATGAFGILSSIVATTNGAIDSVTRPTLEECVETLKARQQSNPWGDLAIPDYEGTCRMKGNRA